MIARRPLMCGCCAGIALRPARAGAQQAAPGPFTPEELTAARATYAAYVTEMFTRDLLQRLPPSLRAAVGKVRLELPPELPGPNPGFPLHIVADPAGRRVILPLRTLRWFDEYCGVVAHLERRNCEARTVLQLVYAGMVAQPGAVRPPGPFAAFGLTDRIYDDAFVKDISNKLFASTLFFLLAHELGHLARQHRGGLGGLASQTQEREADAFALEVMAQVGLFPLGLSVLFTATAMMEGGQSTHPLSGSRVDAAARAVEARPRDFVDRSERNPDAWVPRILALAAQVRAAIPIVDEPERRAEIRRIGGVHSFADLRAAAARLCRL